MKFTLTTFTLLILALTNFEMAQAKCFYGDPAEFNTTCLVKPGPNNGAPKIHFFGKIYCEVGSGGSTGISISDKGIVGFFAPNLGAPNPYTYFTVVNRSSQIPSVVQELRIQEIHKSTGEPIGEELHYNFRQDQDVISSDEAVFSTKACE